MKKALYVLAVVALIAGYATSQSTSIGGRTILGLLDATGATHTAPIKVVANTGALPSTGCTPGELAVVTAATIGQQIYENSGTGSCTWTQQLNSGGVGVSTVGHIAECTFDGGGSTITTNSICYKRLPANGSITGWSIEAIGSSPGITVDVLKIASGATLPTASIAASALPVLTSTNNAAVSTSVSTWCSSAPTTCITANDILALKVTVPGNATWAHVAIFYDYR